MIEISIAYPNDLIYKKVSEFAREVYVQELQAHTDPAPNLFAYAVYDGQLVGCLGLYQPRCQDPLLFETYISNACEKLSGDPCLKRSSLAEIGTRVVQLPGLLAMHSSDVSVALTAVVVSAAYRLGVRYVGFTTTRLVKRITNTLGFTLIVLGEPDLSTKEVAFRENWQKFFRVPQICAGFAIWSLDGCETALTRLKKRGIHVREQIEL